jgi:hypothetical protein
MLQTRNFCLFFVVMVMILDGNGGHASRENVDNMCYYISYRLQAEVNSEQLNRVVSCLVGPHAHGFLGDQLFYKR